MNLLVVAPTLIVFSGILLGPASSWLARASWPHQAPRSAVALWQAIGLGALVSGIGAGLCVAVTRYHAGFVGGVGELTHGIVDGHLVLQLGVPDALGLTLAADLLTVLLVVVVAAMLQTKRVRSEHRTLLSLLARTGAPLQADVIDDARPVAYCVPGRPPRVVISQGALQLLSEEEAGAVIDHERCHAHGHHGLVLLPLRGVGLVIGWTPYGRLVAQSVAELLEMAADDYAVRRHDSLTLARALERMSTPTAVPAGAYAVASNTVSLRIARLTGSSPPSHRPVVLGGALMVAVMLAPVALLLAA